MKILILEDTLIEQGFTETIFGWELESEFYHIPTELIYVPFNVVESDIKDFDYFLPSKEIYFKKEWCFLKEGL